MEMNVHGSSKFILILIILFTMAGGAYLLLEVGGRLGLYQTRMPEGGPPYFLEGTAVADDEVAAIEEEITCSRNNAIVQAAKKVGPSVVSISTVQIRTVRDPFYDPFFPRNPGMKRKSYGLGSGFIIDKRGYILTNQHVVEDADEIAVTLSNGARKRHRAKRYCKGENNRGKTPTEASILLQLFSRSCRRKVPWAGLLASGSTYSPRLPTPWGSGIRAGFVPGYSSAAAADSHRSSLGPILCLLARHLLSSRFSTILACIESKTDCILLKGDAPLQLNPL